MKTSVRFIITGIFLLALLAMQMPNQHVLAVPNTVVDTSVQNIAMSLSTLPATPLSGKVYQDYNGDGKITTVAVNDNGVAGVTVTAYDPNGDIVGTAVTDANGDYTINPSADGPYRVEFSTLPAGYEPTGQGTQNGTSVQFVTSAPATNINFGISRPQDYCQDNPMICSPVYVNGSQQTSNRVLVANDYNNTVGLQTVAQASEIGATWGVAYQRLSKTIFASAVLKRHAGLGAGKDGVLNTADDLGSIYLVDYSAGTGAGTVLTSQTIDLVGMGINVGANPRIGSSPANDLTSDVTVANHDYGVWENVGRVGLGGIALSPDEQTLYVVNLNQANPQLVALNVSDLNNVTLQATYAIPNPGCPGTDSYAPWAVDASTGSVLVGVVCTADVSADAVNLRAYVLKLSGKTFSPIDLDSLSANNFVHLYYDRSCSYFYTPSSFCYKAEWGSWVNPYVAGLDGGGQYHMPVLSDMAFAPDGSLTMGLMDILGHRTGYKNYMPP